MKMANLSVYPTTIVPPVANAVTNRAIQKSQNHGIKAVAIPETNWIKTATTNGMRRPTLIEKI